MPTTATLAVEQPATEFPPTPEQAAIIDAAAAGRNVVATAGAGSGKTSTMVLVARALEARNSHQRTTYIAYNSAARNDARGRMPRSAKAMTAHGLAYRQMVCGPHKAMWDARLNPRYRQSATESARHLGITRPTRISEFEVLSPAQLARIVLRTVTRFCYSGEARITWRHVAIPERLEDDRDAKSRLWRLVPPLAQRAWDTDLTLPDGNLPFDHDYYLKAWHLSAGPDGQGPRIDADTIILDEAQDANPVMASLVWRQMRFGTQVILVGDANQAIYGWRGAVDAMGSFAQLPNFATLALSQSFRFGPAVATEANRWLTLLESPLRIRGFDKIPSTVGPVDTPDAILCRTNAGVIAEALEQIKEGWTVAVVGGTGEIRRFAEAALDLKAGRPTDHPDLYAFTSWQQLQDYVESTDDDAARDLQTYVKLVEEHGADVILDMARGTLDEQDADVVLSTAHKSKGREWDAVRIGDFREPREDKNTGRYILDPAELMLGYVAVTRAKKQLDLGGLAWIGRAEEEQRDAAREQAARLRRQPRP